MRAVSVFDTSVLCRCVHADALNRERLAISADIQRGEVERVRAVEVHSLWAGASGWITITNEVLQAGIADQAERFNSSCGLRGDDAVGILLGHGERMVRDQVRTGGSERTTHDAEAIRHLHVAGLGAQLAGRRVGHFVDTVLMVIGGEEDHVGDLVVSDELQQGVALSAVAADEGLTTVGVYRAVSSVRAGAKVWQVAQA